METTQTTATPKRRSTTSTASSRRTPAASGPTDPVTAYARAVIDGETPAGLYVRLACQRHLKDLVEGPARGLTWDLPAALYAIRFFSLLKHSKGEFARREFILSPWQKFIIGSIFGWKAEDGFRRFRSAWIEIPRKNGKSTLLAGVGLYCLVADGEDGAEVYAAATRKDQARIIFEEARKMVLKSASLSDKLGVYKLNISCPETGSKFEPLSSDEQTLDGLNPSALLVDEIHKHRDRKLIDVLDTATGARRQPLFAAITTAGDESDDTPYAAEHDDAVKILTGAFDDDRVFVYIARADDDDDPYDPITWEKANPNWLVSVKRADMERQAAKARRAPSALAAFKRLRLDIRTGAGADPLFTREAWEACEVQPADFPDLTGHRGFGALDLSEKLDLTARALAFPVGDIVYAVLKFWTPADTLLDRELKDRRPYTLWRDQGYLTPVPGKAIDFAYVAGELGADRGAYDLQAVAYDRWRIHSLRKELDDQGIELPLVEHGQGFKDMSPSIEALEELVANGRLKVLFNPVLRNNIANAKLEKDAAGNRKFTKRKSTGRIDGAQALAMVCKHVMAGVEETPPPSVLIL